MTGPAEFGQEFKFDKGQGVGTISAIGVFTWPLLSVCARAVARMKILTPLNPGAPHPTLGKPTLRIQWRRMGVAGLRDFMLGLGGRTTVPWCG